MARVSLKEISQGRQPKSAPDKIGLQFRSLLEGLPAAAYTCDPQGLITYFNQHAVQLWGRSPKLNDPVDRFCGSFKLFSTDGTPIAHDQCWMALALQRDKEYLGHEIVIERPDGQRLTVLAHANPIRDESGQLLGAVNVLVDISDRKRAEEATARLAAIVESSEDAIISKTLDGRILSWNAGAERLFGYTADEAIGQPITLIIPLEKHGEERLILAQLRRGERIEHYETIRVSKQGRRLNISLTSSPVRDSTGRIIGASKIARDITARKQAEEALVAAKNELATQVADLQRLHQMSLRLSTTLELQAILEETLRTAAAIEGTDLGLLSLCDPEHNCLEIKAKLGFNEDFLNAIERVPPRGEACATCFQERRRVVVEDVETDPIFAPYRESARQAGFRAVHSTPLITRSGNVVGVLSTHFRQPHRPSPREMRLVDLCARQAVDFIENARLYAQLQEADRRKDEFLAILAHELRNPLAPIRNSLSILRMTGRDGVAAERFHEIMERQVNHMVRLVDDLLEVSRITLGRIELRKERVELASVLRSAIETARPFIEGASHQLYVSIPSEPFSLEADAVRLAQVFANLLNNAAKYTDKGGKIWVSAQREGDSVTVSVRDSGIGIAKEMLPRVFEMFTQGNRDSGRAQSGLGIGLAVVRNLLHMHGGSVEAKSAGPGQGSEFLVYLPLATDLSTDAAQMQEEAVASLSPPRVLVVDDNRDAADSLGMLLRSTGADAHVVYNGAAALEALEIYQPGIVLLDICMPGMDGYEVARRIRNQPQFKNVMLVALTGWGQEEDRRRSRSAGFDHHLIKPADVSALQALMASLVSRAIQPQHLHEA